MKLAPSTSTPRHPASTAACAERPHTPLAHGQRFTTATPRTLPAGLGALLLLLTACGSSEEQQPDPPVAPPVALRCDDSLKTGFRPDPQTTVLLVKAYRAGEPLALAGTTGTPPVAASDLCLVKLQVGPGNPGSPGAPSTSPGIGIEVWLPSAERWNERIRNLGGGGWAGGNHLNTSLIASTAAAALAGQGYVSGTTDTGHGSPGGSFTMREDGTVNTALWQDYSVRSLVQLAQKTRLLAAAYYLKPQRFAYWQGCSTGGRQGYKIAQEHPDLYDGYLNEAPVLGLTRLSVSMMYPQTVIRRDLVDNGMTVTPAQLAFVSGRAVSACDAVGSERLGFILDPRQCRYDPTRDAAALCNGVTGQGVVGTSTQAACLNLEQARAVNKIWYGMTVDGSVPDPQFDAGGNAFPFSGAHLWWGVPRGASLMGVANPGAPFPVAADMVAIALQDPSFGAPNFINATGNGSNRWRSLSYAGLAFAFQQTSDLQALTGQVDTDRTDLAGVRDRRAKIIHFHGWGDQLVSPMGSINYYTRVANQMGGFAEVQKFNRLFLVPGMGHCNGIGAVNGTDSPPANADRVPMPSDDEFFAALVSWVEGGTAPDRIVGRSANGSVTMPVCPFPSRAVYNGSGSIVSEASYTCQ